MSENWVIRKNPARLERRFEFGNYDQTREFLDRAAEVAKSEGYYPDMSFGRTHVCITLQPQGENAELSDALMRYARLLDALAPAAQTSH
ncbi:MAG: 4a-hydroxytetrahydrobiopterin dehydratase [Pseudomonadota bacterium]